MGGAGEVEVRWLPGLGPSCPGAVDLAMVGPHGQIAKAVTLPEALTTSLVIDLFCPGSNLYETISQLAPCPSPAHERPRQ